MITKIRSYSVSFFFYPSFLPGTHPYSSCIFHFTDNTGAKNNLSSFHLSPLLPSSAFLSRFYMMLKLLIKSCATLILLVPISSYPPQLPFALWHPTFDSQYCKLLKSHLTEVERHPAAHCIGLLYHLLTFVPLSVLRTVRSLASHVPVMTRVSHSFPFPSLSVF